MKIAISAKPLFATELISPLDLSQQVTDYHRNGLPRGDSTGWPSVDDHYTIMPGQWSLFSGIPGHGKSEFLDGLMVNLATSKDWRFIVFSPENQPHEMHVSKLIEKWIGKPFGHGPNDRVTPDELSRAMAWLDLHFRFIKPSPALQIPSMAAILDAAARSINTFADASGYQEGDRFGIVVDPWNELEHRRPASQSETEYISETLAEVRQFAREYRVHVWIVAHPKIMQRDRDGIRPVPTPYDVSGSAHWFNKADNCITVWRDMNPENSTSIVQVHVQKIRFKNVGKVGLVELRYDRVTGRYHEPLPQAVKGYRAARDGE